MRKTMSEMQLDFCLDVYEQVQEVVSLKPLLLISLRASMRSCGKRVLLRAIRQKG